MTLRNIRPATFAAMLAIPLAIGPARADPAQVLQGTCATNNTYAGTANECLGPQATPDLRFTSAGPQFNYLVTFQASPMHCSRVGLHVFTYDLSRTLGGTRLLNPGQTETVSIGHGYAAGLQIAKVKAFGWISDEGCNRGFLQSWSATATVVQQ
jgi:hypothetical protein